MLFFQATLAFLEVLVLAQIAFCGPALGAGNDGAQIYRNRCASCHDGASPENPMPTRADFKAMAPQRIFQALSGGVMSKQGAALSEDDKRKVSEYLSGKTFVSAVPDDANRCAAEGGARFRLDGPGWAGWGGHETNDRYRSSDAAGFNAKEIPKLKLRWAFGISGGEPRGQPAVLGGRVFFGASSGGVYSLDARTGCVHWRYAAGSEVRTAMSLAELPSEGGARHVLLFGDLGGTVYALEAETGKELWKVRVDDHPFARITGAPLLRGARLYVPVSSSEEKAAANPQYACCTFRGSLLAMDIKDGKILWKAYMIPVAAGKVPSPMPQETHPLWGPSGVAIWSTPTYDAKLDRIYVATGNNYSGEPTSNADAIVALEAASGKIAWSRSMTRGDLSVSCRNNRANPNCPKELGGDFDFGSSAVLKELPKGKRVIVAAQKSGVVYAIDPDREGRELWHIRVAQGSPLGGVQWGIAADDRNAYVGVSDVYRPELNPSSPTKDAGKLFALRLVDGHRVWKRNAPRFSCPPDSVGCVPALSAPVSAIAGAVFAGAIDGHLRAYSAADGKVLWDYDANRGFATVNGVKAKGGSFDGNGGGPVAADRMLLVNAGYGKVFSSPGNALLLFSLD